MSNIIFGYISSYDAKRHMARVMFPDKDNLVSDWLPVIVTNSLLNKDEAPLDINEHVAVIMGDNMQSGVIIGAIYDDQNKPLNADKDTRITTFDDGTKIEYNRSQKTMRINAVGGVEINAAKEIKITSALNVIIAAPSGVNISSGATSIACRDSGKSLEIKSNGDINIDSPDIIKIKSDKDIEIESGGLLKLKGSLIKLDGKVI